MNGRMNKARYKIQTPASQPASYKHTGDKHSISQSNRDSKQRTAATEESPPSWLCDLGQMFRFSELDLQSGDGSSPGQKDGEDVMES